MAGTVLLALAEVFALFGLGFLIRKRGYLENLDITKWSKVLIDFFFPLLAFQSIVRDLETDRLVELLPLPILGFCFMAFGALLGILFAPLLKSGDKNIKKTFLHLCTANNFSSLPLFIISRVWGDSILAKLFFFNLGSAIAFWTIGVGFLRSGKGDNTLKNIFSPNIVAIIAGLLVALAGGGRWFPPFILDIMQKAGFASLQMSMMLIGAALVGVSLNTNKRDITLLSLIRLTIFPIITILVLRVLPLALDVYRIALVVAIMPASMQSPLLTRRFGGNPDFAAAVLLITTLISMGSIPLWFALFM